MILEETLQKIGRNVLAFQRLEAMLKLLVARKEITAPVSQLKETQQRQIDLTARQTMGNLVREYLSIYSTEGAATETPEEIEEIWISYSFKVEADPTSLEQRRLALTAIVEERNALIHQTLARFDTSSIRSCEELNGVLDEQYERMKPQFEELKLVAKRFQQDAGGSLRESNQADTGFGQSMTVGAHNMALKPTHLVVTPFAYAKAAPPAAGGLTQCYVPLA